MSLSTMAPATSDIIRNSQYQSQYITGESEVFILAGPFSSIEDQ